MSIFFYLGSIFFIICAFYLGKWIGQRHIPDISVKYAMDIMKKNLVGLIVFYQGNYSEEDQISLIKRWLDSIDFEKVNNEQLDLFKKYVEEL